MIFFKSSFKISSNMSAPSSTFVGVRMSFGAADFDVKKMAAKLPHEASEIDLDAEGEGLEFQVPFHLECACLEIGASCAIPNKHHYAPARWIRLPKSLIRKTWMGEMSGSITAYSTCEDDDDPAYEWQLMPYY